MLKVVVGHSEDPDSQYAVDEVLEQCFQDLMGMAPTAGILFAAIDFDHAMILEEILRVYPEIELIGCTTDGEMSSKLGFCQDSLTLMLFCSDTIKIHAGVGIGASKNPDNAASQAVQQVTAKSTHTLKGCGYTTKLCIALPASYIGDGATANGEMLLKGLGNALGSEVPIIGGAAGDQSRAKITYQFYGSKVLTDSLSILTFGGDVVFSFGAACGWRPLGRKSIITKACGNRLYEIDGIAAVEFYQRYLSGRLPSAENSLAVYEGDSERYYIRVPNSLENDGSIRLLADIPEQATVQLTGTSRDEIITSSLTSFQTAVQNYPGNKIDAVLLFSCCCRRWLLGTRAKEEYEIIKNALPYSVPVCGFYTYGELAPLQQRGASYYHQETFVTLLIGTN
ncbi:hypothetical protein NIES2101_19370 [Calothrix sp. HK-06]|nr:hypothetical protein NIES2101_19370 [Calothrix sp. HK-06]